MSIFSNFPLSQNIMQSLSWHQKQLSLTISGYSNICVSLSTFFSLSGKENFISWISTLV